MSDGLPDAAKANDADRFSPDSKATQGVIDLKPLPVAAPHNVVQINQASTDRYHQSNREVCRILCNDVRRIADVNTTLGSG
jgi:hypothetical protein